MTPVKSSNIEAVGYDDDKKRLTVRFKSGGTWHYEDVPADVHKRFVSADSIGRFFAAHIRNGYKAVRG